MVCVCVFLVLCAWIVNTAVDIFVLCFVVGLVGDTSRRCGYFFL
jgi:hypothetical protein